MNLPVIKAEGDLSGVIYMVVVVLWVLGNLLSRSKKAKNRPRIPRPDESSTERELREFLETIQGKPQSEEDRHEDVPAAPVARTEPSPARPVVRVKERRQPKPMPVALPPPPPPRQQPVQAPSAKMPDVAVFGRAVITSSMGSSFAAVLRGRGNQIKLGEARVITLKQAMSMRNSLPTAPLLTRAELRDKRQLRKLMAARIILDSPKAFEVHDVPQAIRH